MSTSTPEPRQPGPDTWADSRLQPSAATPRGPDATWEDPLAGAPGSRPPGVTGEAPAGGRDSPSPLERSRFSPVPPDRLGASAAPPGAEDTGELGPPPTTVGWEALHGLASRYRLRGELGRGSSAVVYRAWDPRLRREVAIKVLFAASERQRRRFLREAEVVAELRHERIVAVHDMGELLLPGERAGQGLCYLILDYVEGRRLDHAAEGRGLPAEDALRVVRDVARAAHHAHERGVLHRDINPGNVMVDPEGRGFLLDFGLAWRHDAERLTLTGAGLGTLAYAAPEQAAGPARDRRTDVYGLGATLYFALTGKGPFEDAPDPLMAIFRLDPPPPSSRVPAVPAELEAVCLRCLEKDPARRFQTAEELASALERLLAADFGASARRPRGPLLAAAGLALAAAAVGGLVAAGAGAEADAPSPVPVAPTPAIDPALAEREARAREALERGRRLVREMSSFQAPLDAFAEARRLAPPGSALREEVLLETARTLYRRMRYREALRYLEPLRDAEGAAAREAAVYRGLAHHGRGETEEGQAALLAAAEVDAADVWGALAAAAASLRGREPGRALEGARLARRRDGDLALAHLLEGRALSALGREEAARTALAEAARLAPDDAHAHLALGLLSVLPAPERLAALERGVSLGEPEPPPEALLERGRLRLLDGRPLEEAFADLDRAVRRASDDRPARAWRGVVLALGEQPEEARRDWEAAGGEALRGALDALPADMRARVEAVLGE